MGGVFLVPFSFLILLNQGLQGLLVVGRLRLPLLILLPVEQHGQRIDLAPERFGGQHAQQEVTNPAVEQHVPGVCDDARADDLGDLERRLTGRHLLVEVVELPPEVA